MKAYILPALIVLCAACAPKNYPATTNEENALPSMSESMKKAQESKIFDSGAFYDPNPVMERR